MLCARLYSYKTSFVVEECPDPEIIDDRGVIIRVKGAGFCHSDIHIVDGEIPILPKMPIILGHENAGIVYKVGKSVKNVKEGDKVVVYGGWGCGYCNYCIRGDEQLCLNPRWVGLSEYDGGYAQYLYVPDEKYLVKLSNLEPEVACIYADAGLTPYRAYKKIKNLIEGEEFVLSIGCGGLGQFGIKILKALTPAKIIAIDINDEKLEKAKEYGADYIINSNLENAYEKIMDLTNGNGVIASLDFVGSNQTLSLALRSTKNSGKVIQIGLAGGSANIKILENTKFEVSFEFSLWGNLKELRELISLAEIGKITPIDIEFFELKDINDVYKKLKENKIKGRAVIKP